MRRFRGLTYTVVLSVLVAVALLRLDVGALAQVDAPPPATPPLIEEVSRLVSDHFYDRGVVERVWTRARAAHTAALPADATSFHP